MKSPNLCHAAHADMRLMETRPGSSSYDPSASTRQRAGAAQAGQAQPRPQAGVGGAFVGGSRSRPTTSQQQTSGSRLVLICMGPVGCDAALME